MSGSSEAVVDGGVLLAEPTATVAARDVPTRAVPAFHELAGVVGVSTLVSLVAFLTLFATPIRLLVRDWVTLPEAGHGLLLGPVALYLAWRSGVVADRRPRRLIGVGILFVAILLRFVGGLAAELFTLRISIIVA